VAINEELIIYSSNPNHIDFDDVGIKVSPKDVRVQGRGGQEEVLHEIAAIRKACAREPDNSTGPSRRYQGRDEFKELVKRVRDDKASVVLRKKFLCAGQCSVMQEIWIKDPKNPDVVREAGDPLKAYTIVHVHHHSQVRIMHVDDIQDAEHFKIVDAINVRHLAAASIKSYQGIAPKPCQGDNPFFDTFIEPSGGPGIEAPYKLFPEDPEWTCDKCHQTNRQAAGSCKGQDWTCRLQSCG